MKNKSIKKTLISKLSIGFSVIFCTTFIITFLMVESILSNSKVHSMDKRISDAATIVEQRIGEHITLAQAIATDNIIANSTLTFEEKLPRLEQYIKKFNIKSIGLANKDGNLKSTDNFTSNVSDREYFQNIFKDIPYISSPTFIKGTEDQIIFIGVPLRENDVIIGMMTCTFSSDYLSEFITDIEYEEMGEAYILGKTGRIIANRDIEKVRSAYNIIEKSEEDKSLEPLATIHKKMIA